MRWRLVSALVACALGCEAKNEPLAAGSPASAPSTLPTVPLPAAPSVAAADPGAVSVGENATFGDLVAAAKRAGGGAKEPRCLLRGGKAGAAASFEALLVPAKGIDDPLEDLDAVMAIQHGPEPNFDRDPRLVASWGDTSGGGLLDLVALCFVPTRCALRARPRPEAVRSRVGTGGFARATERATRRIARDRRDGSGPPRRAARPGLLLAAAGLR